ncbi:MAG: MoaD/ThiS family protein [Candidatus Dormibacteria bacterium]
MLTGIRGEVQVEVAEPPSVASVLDALEAQYPALRGTMRDQASGVRRPFIRFYASEEDLSQEPMDAPLPPAVAGGAEPLAVVGAMSGG